jgi:hypothetical protein
MAAVHSGDAVVEIFNRLDYLMKLVNIKNKLTRFIEIMPGNVGF